MIAGEDRPASDLEWSSSNGRRRAHVIARREVGDTTCAVVTYRLPAALFRRGSVEDVPLPGVMLSQARVSPCTAKTMVAGDKRLPCCRSHFGAWLQRAPVEALTLGVHPVFVPHDREKHADHRRLGCLCLVW